MAPAALLLLIIVLFAPLLWTQAKTSQAPDVGRFAGVKAWRLSIRVHGTFSGTREQARHSFRIDGTSEIKLERDFADTDAIGWKSKEEEKGSGNIGHNGEIKEAEGGSTVNSEGKLGFSTLHIDPKKKVYTLESSLHLGNGTMKVTGGGQTQTFDAPEAMFNLPEPYAASQALPLPAQGLTIKGEQDADVLLFPMMGPKDGKYTVRVEWMLTPWDQEEPKAYIEKFSQDWLPSSDGKSPAEINVTWENGTAFEVKLTLLESTKYPGEHGNSKSSGTEDDLEFDPNSGYRIQKEDGKWTAILKDPPPGKARMEVVAKDGAAWGRIQVEVKVNGKWVKAKQRGSGEEELTIPLDKNKNKIGDAWERQEGIDGQNLDIAWDEEEVNGQASRGDGYTLLEEYRGLEGIQNGGERKFARLNAKRKDLAVANGLGERGQGGLQMIESAAEIEVTDVGTLPTNKIVIKNNVPGKTSKQTGVLIKVGDLAKMGLPNLVGTVAVTMPEQPEKKNRPSDVDAIYVSQVDLANYPANVPDKQKFVEYLVAHELGHAIGAMHHGPDQAQNANGIARTIKPTDSYTGYAGVAAYDSKGLDLRKFKPDGTARGPKEDVVLEGNVGRPHGVASGDVGCIMTYNTWYKWCMDMPPTGPEEFFAAEILPVGKKMCRDGFATGRNKLKRGVDGSQVTYFGDAAKGRGNCMKMINVKD